MASQRVASSVLLGAAIIVLAVAANHSSEARFISYGAMMEGYPIWVCNSFSRKHCLPEPSNPLPSPVNSDNELNIAPSPGPTALPPGQYH